MQLIIQKKKRSRILKLVRRAFKTPFALEEYQAGNRQGTVVFGKEAATGLHQDYEDWDCWWTDSMAWRWHFRGTTVTTDAILFRTFRFTPIDDFLAFYQNLRFHSIDRFFVLDFALGIIEYLAVHWFRPWLLTWLLSLVVCYPRKSIGSK